MLFEEERINGIVDRLTPISPPDVNKRANWDKVHTRHFVGLVKRLGKIHQLAFLNVYDKIWITQINPITGSGLFFDIFNGLRAKF